MKEIEYIEGPRACFEALNSGAPIQKIFVGKYINTKSNKNISRIISESKLKNIKVNFYDKNTLDKMSHRGSHQGIIAQIAPFSYSSVKEILQQCTNKNSALVVVLDHIKDAGNLGAIARSAEAFGASGMIIANKRAANVTAATYKTSAGAVCRMPIAKVANISAALDMLKSAEFWVAAASEHTNSEIWDQNLKGKIAIVMGAEHEGVSSLVLKNSDFIIKLPMSGQIESLNVAQAFTACAYEWVRQNSQA